MGWFNVLAQSVRLDTEAYWQRELAELWNCPVEVPVVGGRCDLLYGGCAIEVDWAEKWPEAIGQSLYYSCCLGIPPGIVLLLKSEKDNIYLHRLQQVNNQKDLGLSIWKLDTWELLGEVALQNCKHLQYGG